MPWKKIRCSTCGGRGEVVYKGTFVKCTRCKGSGKIEVFVEIKGPKPKEGD